MHIKGIPTSIEKWEENSSTGEMTRQILKMFTSAFKDLIEFNEFTVHCSGLGTLRRTTVTKKMKKKKVTEFQRIQKAHFETWVLDVLPLGFKYNVQKI